MQEKSQLPSTKRRRNILKQEHAVVQNASEVLKGISYQSVCGRVLPHITQMAAYEIQSGATFSVDVIPRLPITSSAQQVTGIVMNGSSMTVNSIPVEAMDIHAEVVGLVKWIKAFPHAVLISHNGRRFDSENGHEY